MQRVKSSHFGLAISTIYYHIFKTRFAVITQSAYAISSFPPTGYQPAVMITGSHVF